MPLRVDECDWYCDECDALLNDQEDFDLYCGVWECTECGHKNKIAESEIIDNQIAVEVYDNEYYKEKEEVPEGCKACGGNYPYCKSGCNMFDD